MHKFIYFIILREIKMDNFDEAPSKYGRIYKVAGPLVVGENMSGSKMYELVKIGWDKLVGEIIEFLHSNGMIQKIKVVKKFKNSVLSWMKKKVL